MESLKQKNKKLLILAVCVVAVILVIGGISLVYSGGKKDKDNGDLAVDYQNGANIAVKNVEDGWKSNKKVTITNKGNKALTYDLVWSKASNTFKTQSDLLYKIDSKGNGASNLGTSQIPVAASPIFETVTIDKGETHIYTVKVWYKKANAGSNEKGSEFSGDLKVKLKEVK